MAVPNFQAFLRPVLETSADGVEHEVRKVRDNIAEEFKLSDADFEELLPSGKQTIFTNRVYWAATYLRKAGLLESTGRGRFKITPSGLDFLSKHPESFTVTELKEIPRFLEFHHGKKKEPKPAQTPLELTVDETPEETIQRGFEILRQELADEVLSMLKNASPAFFERIVVDVLVKMGYGGSVVDAGEAVGRSGDGGIDGVIKEDKLGLDIIYVQAKRWENTIQSPEVQKFAGALAGRKAKKGVFITTSDFSKGAIDFARGLESKIVLINGEQLAQMLIDNDVGVSPIASYEVKKVDSDYFIED